MNLCGRAEGAALGSRGRNLPSGGARAGELPSPTSYAYPDPGGSDLRRVSQYVYGVSARGRSTEGSATSSTPTTRRPRFTTSWRGAPALRGRRHRFSSSSPRTTTTRSSALRRRRRAVRPRVVQGRRRRPRALRALGAGGEPERSTAPNEYCGLALEQRTVILKIHGAVDRDRRRAGQLRHHRGPLHRLPRARDISQLSRSRSRAAAQQQLPVPRLRPARLEPARDPPPDLGRAGARPQVVGDPARARPYLERRAEVLAEAATSRS